MSPTPVRHLSARPLRFISFAPALVVGLFLTTACSPSEGPGRGLEGEAPTLVVMVSVDQLRGDIWERYDTLFTGGIRRLHDQGFRFSNATHGHARTTTAAGHATLGTGTHPRTHGIVSNDWWVETPDSMEEVYSMRDLDSPLLGYPEEEGRSPVNMFRAGLGDWLLAAEPRARVVSISRKDRAAIALGGKSRGQVYWIVPEAGQFTTSTYFRSDLPGWVSEYNADVMPGLFADTIWETRVPVEARSLTRNDTTEYERFHPLSAFPHHGLAEVGPQDSPEELVSALNEWVSRTPVEDIAIAGLVIRAIDELSLGQNGHLDYLAVSFSATDHVGHDYGPNSREQLDNQLNLDEQLGRLMDHLDAAVGEGRWVMALSADHGVVDEPDLEGPGGGPLGYRVIDSDRDRWRRIAEAAASGELAGEARSRSVAAALEDDPMVAEVYAYADLEGGEPVDSLARMSWLSHVSGRHLKELGQFGVVVRLPEFYLDRDYLTGSGHGTTYHYDRWVPLILLGSGVTPGVSVEPVATVDVAPTLATWAGIPTPDDLDGRDIRPR